MKSRFFGLLFCMGFLCDNAHAMQPRGTASSLLLGKSLNSQSNKVVVGNNTTLRSSQSQGFISLSSLAKKEDVSQSHNASASAAQPTQQRRAVPEISLRHLMAQGTLKGTNACIRLLIKQNPEQTQMLKEEARRIDAQMDAEFVAEMQDELRQDYEKFPNFKRLTREQQNSVMQEDIEFKCAQYKAFAFAKAFPEQEVGAVPDSPRKKTYTKKLAQAAASPVVKKTGRLDTPPASPTEKKSSRKRLFFSDDVEVSVIPNVKRVTKRQRIE
jgi:hypothetical protein